MIVQRFQRGSRTSWLTNQSLHHYWLILVFSISHETSLLYPLRFRIFLTKVNQPSGSTPAMPRRLNDGDPGRFTAAALLFIGLISCLVVYAVFSTLLRPQDHALDSAVRSQDHSRVDGGGGCCRGVDNLELWGSAVKWGTDFKFNSSDECCKACKVMCSGNHGPCLCDSWVFCGDKEACGSKFGEVSLWSLVIVSNCALF